MVTADIADWEGLLANIPKSIVYEGDGLGKEMKPNITVLYGFLSSVNANTVKGLLRNSSIPEMAAWATNLSIFENDAYNVLKVGAYSPCLHYARDFGYPAEIKLGGLLFSDADGKTTEITVS